MLPFSIPYIFYPGLAFTSLSVNLHSSNLPSLKSIIVHRLMRHFSSHHYCRSIEANPCLLTGLAKDLMHDCLFNLIQFNSLFLPPSNPTSLICRDRYKSWARLQGVSLVWPSLCLCTALPDRLAATARQTAVLAVALTNKRGRREARAVEGSFLP